MRAPTHAATVIVEKHVQPVAAWLYFIMSSRHPFTRRYSILTLQLFVVVGQPPSSQAQEAQRNSQVPGRKSLRLAHRTATLMRAGETVTVLLGSVALACPLLSTTCLVFFWSTTDQNRSQMLLVCHHLLPPLPISNKHQHSHQHHHHRHLPHCQAAAESSPPIIHLSSRVDK
jgi:hypothetical protein